MKPKTFLSVLCVVFFGLVAPPAFAQQLHPKNKKVDSGDFPEHFFATAAQWHVTNSRNRLAIDVLVAQFPSMPKDFVVLTDKKEVSNEDIDKFIESCCQGEYAGADDAVIALTSAIIESEGRYAVAPGAPKQSGKAQKETMRRANRVKEVLLRGEGFGSYEEAMKNAITYEMRKGDYEEAIRLLQANFERVARIGTLKPEELGRAISEELDKDRREVFLMGLSAVMASKGRVGWSGKTTKKDAERKKNVDAAIALYKSSGVKDIAMDASVLESDPTKRNEYFRFVHDAAVNGKFQSSRGWRHAARMYEQLGKEADNALERIDPWTNPPEPSYDDQSCG